MGSLDFAPRVVRGHDSETAARTAMQSAAGGRPAGVQVKTHAALDSTARHASSPRSRPVEVDGAASSNSRPRTAPTPTVVAAVTSAIVASNNGPLVLARGIVAASRGSNSINGTMQTAPSPKRPQARGVASARSVPSLQPALVVGAQVRALVQRHRGSSPVRSGTVVVGAPVIAALSASARHSPLRARGVSPLRGSSASGVAACSAGGHGQSSPCSSPCLASLSPQPVGWVAYRIQDAPPTDLSTSRPEVAQVSPGGGDRHDSSATSTVRPQLAQSVSSRSVDFIQRKLRLQASLDGSPVTAEGALSLRCCSPETSEFIRNFSPCSRGSSVRDASPAGGVVGTLSVCRSPERRLGSQAGSEPPCRPLTPVETFDMTKDDRSPRPSASEAGSQHGGGSSLRATIRTRSAASLLQFESCSRSLEDAAAALRRVVAPGPDEAEHASPHRWRSASRIPAAASPAILAAAARSRTVVAAEHTDLDVPSEASSSNSIGIAGVGAVPGLDAGLTRLQSRLALLERENADLRASLPDRQRLLQDNAALRARIHELEEERERFFGEGIFDVVNQLSQNPRTHASLLISPRSVRSVAATGACSVAACRGTPAEPAVVGGSPQANRGNRPSLGGLPQLHDRVAAAKAVVRRLSETFDASVRAVSPQSVAR